METILAEILKFIGTSAVGGLTWDIMKKTSGQLLETFKRRFSAEKYFQNEDQAEEFLQKISTKESLYKRRPFEDAWAVYDSCTGLEATDSFKADFEKWIREAGPNIVHSAETFHSINGMVIHEQINKDNATVINIGNRYN